MTQFHLCGRLVVLFGLPGSGKSTLARHIRNVLTRTAPKVNTGSTPVEGNTETEVALCVKIIEFDDFLIHQLAGAAVSATSPVAVVDPSGSTPSKLLNVFFSPALYHQAQVQFHEAIYSEADRVLLEGQGGPSNTSSTFETENRSPTAKNPCHPCQRKFTIIIAVDIFPFSSTRLKLWQVISKLNTELLAKVTTTNVTDASTEDFKTPRLIDFHQVFLDTPLDKALERNETRRGRYQEIEANSEASSSRRKLLLLFDPYVPAATITAMDALMDKRSIARSSAHYHVLAVSESVVLDCANLESPQITSSTNPRDTLPKHAVRNTEGAAKHECCTVLEILQSFGPSERIPRQESQSDNPQLAAPLQLTEQLRAQYLQAIEVHLRKVVASVMSSFSKTVDSQLRGATSTTIQKSISLLKANTLSNARSHLKKIFPNQPNEDSLISSIDGNDLMAGICADFLVNLRVLLLKV